MQAIRIQRLNRPVHSIGRVNYHLGSSHLILTTSIELQLQLTPLFQQVHVPINADMADTSQRALNTAIREYCKAAEQLTGDSTWLLKREIPTTAEVLQVDIQHQPYGTRESSTGAVELVANKIVGKWSSKDEYIGAHYNLLREDVIGPFKEAIEHFRNRVPNKENETFCAYDKVSGLLNHAHTL
jgi:hypothetical protein